MRLPVLCFVVLGLLFCPGPCLSQSNEGTRRSGRNKAKPLLAAEEAPPGRFSYMCSLRYQGSHDHFCGAFLVRPDWMITAAHCIARDNDSSVTPVAYCGIQALNQTDPSLFFDVGLSYVHEDWGGDVNYGFDIALLRLDRNSSSTLEDLPQLDAGDNFFGASERLTALGWGATPTADYSNELQMARTLELVPSDTCNEDWWDGSIKEDRMICAGLGEEQVCEGDSGGPLIRPHIPQGKVALGNTSSDVIVGITSFNYEPEKCGQRKRPGVFTRVAFFVDWISDKIGEDITNGRSSLPLDEPETGEKDLSTLLPLELVERMKEAFNKDDAERAELILEHLHVKETLKATIPGAGISDLPLLHAAAMFDAPKCAQVMIDAGAGVESRVDDFYEMRPIHVCGIFGSLKVAKVLLNPKNGASVNSRDSVSDVAMHKAATHGHVELIEFLIKKTADEDLFPINVFGDSPLHEAARVGHEDGVKFLLEKGVSIDHKNKDSWTPLHYAAFNNHTAVVEVLLDKGAEVNAEDTVGETPLHKASWNGNVEVIRVLLRNRADLSSRDNRGHTAMLSAIWNGQIEPVEIFLSSNVSANSASNSGYTALHLASAKGHTAIARLLIEKGASVEAEDDDEETPLSEAVRYGHVDVVKLLARKGARVETYRRGFRRYSLLHVASARGYLKVVKFLLRSGADVKAESNEKYTPLHVAAQNGHYEVVQELLDAGALKNVRRTDGPTPRSGSCDDSSCDDTTRYALRFMLQA